MHRRGLMSRVVDVVSYRRRQRDEFPNRAAIPRYNGRIRNYITFAIRVYKPPTPKPVFVWAVWSIHRASAAARRRCKLQDRKKMWQGNLLKTFWNRSMDDRCRRVSRSGSISKLCLSRYEQLRCTYSGRKRSEQVRGSEAKWW